MRQQPLAQPFLQHLGGEYVGARRQHLAPEFGIELVEVGVAADHQVAGAATAVGRGHLDPIAVVDMGHPGVLEQGDAQAGCRACLAEGQVEGVQVA
ncbi:hypothetical protein D3C77_203380 [compost metagenome]